MWLMILSFAAFIVSCAVWYVYWRFVKGIKPIKGEYRKIGHGSKLKRLFIDFPRQLIHDKLTRDPDCFREFGVHIVSGDQSRGKTITIVYLLIWLKKMYPKLKIKTNFGYVHQDGEIRDWRDVVSSENGIYGEINVIDEMQNWFCSNNSKDFPPEMLGEITHQRKQRKCIFGSSQRFGRLAKPIREQTYYLYQPFTVAGCLTFVFKFKVQTKENDANIDRKRLRGMFFFVHNSELRESYDTYRKIELMSKDGFKPYDQQLRANDVTFNVSKKARIK
jgi:hypothetical protein